MLEFNIRNQTINRVDSFRPVANSIDYLTATFNFLTEDWAGLSKWAHFKQGETIYDIQLENDAIGKDKHLNLSDGVWSVYLHGTSDAGMRITTAVCTVKVEKSGELNGQPLHISRNSIILTDYKNNDRSWSDAFDIIFDTFNGVKNYVILIPRGIYELDRTIVVPEGVLIQGESTNSTIIKSSPRFDGETLVFFPKNTEGGIKNLSIKDNYVKNIKGIVIGSQHNEKYAAINFECNNLEISDCYTAGLSLEGIVWQVMYHHISIFGSIEGSALYIKTNDCLFSDFIINGSYVGLYSVGVANKFSNFKIDWCRGRQDGLDMEDSFGAIFGGERNEYINIEVQQCFYNGALFNTKWSSFQGLIVDATGRANIGIAEDKKGVQVKIDNLTNCIIGLRVTNPENTGMNIYADSESVINSNFGSILVQGNGEKEDVGADKLMASLNKTSYPELHDEFLSKNKNIVFSDVVENIVNFSSLCNITEDGTLEVETTEGLFGGLIINFPNSIFSNVKYSPFKISLVRIIYKIEKSDTETEEVLDPYNLMQSPRVFPVDVSVIKSEKYSENTVFHRDLPDGYREDILFIPLTIIKEEVGEFRFLFQKNNSNKKLKISIKNLGCFLLPNRGYYLDQDCILRFLDNIYRAW